jgi:hypothetical protein
MCIQRKAAEKKGIEFKAVFKNFCLNEYDFEDDNLYRPIIKTDE